MRNTRIGVQLALGFGLMVLLVVASSIGVWFETAQSQRRAESARKEAAGTVALAEAQSTIWALRWGLAQYMLEDGAGREKILAEEPKLYENIRQALEKFAETNPNEDEKRALAKLQEAYGKYVGARPKWFQLYGSGQIEEAKTWRAATTTPFGQQTVKAFAELMETQQQASLADYEDGLRDLAATRRWLAVAAAFAAAAGVLISALIIRGLHRQLGGEPAYAKEVAARIARGDLATEIHVKAGDTDSLVREMATMRDNLRALVGEVVGGARSVAATSSQIAQGNLDLSQRTEEQASTLEETASSLEELTSTVTQNAGNAQQASQLAVDASGVAGRGGEVVGQVVNTMNGISEASRKIADIISVIDGIAFQTNILALNAAVEAARAGDQGRGFAVVAAEVRNLAQRSAAAAKEIKILIGDSVERVESGTKLVDAAGATMNEIVASVKRVSDLIAEIAAASEEQSAGIEQVNRAMAQMDQAVQQNASLVEEASAATESMKDQAGTLLGMVSRFDLGGKAAEAEPAPAAAPAIAPIRVRTAAKPALAHATAPAATPPGEWKAF
jgi:methyl-accepting chemotaxis protein